MLPWDSGQRTTQKYFKVVKEDSQVLPFASANRCPQRVTEELKIHWTEMRLDHDPPDMSIFKQKSERNEKGTKGINRGTGSE